MRRTKSQLVDEISELRQELAALKGEIDGHPKYTVRPAGTAVREADSDPQKFVERFDLALRATNSAIWDWDLETNLFWSSSGHQRLFGRGDSEITENFNLEDDDNP